MTKTEILEAQEAAQDLFERATATLDLRNIPEEHRKFGKGLHWHYVLYSQ